LSTTQFNTEKWNALLAPTVAIMALVLVVVSFSILLFAYSLGPGPIFDGYEAVASLVFWFSILASVLAIPLRPVVELFLVYLRKQRGIAVFVSYISVHLLLYGLILEGILTYLYKVPPLISQPSVNASAILAYPESVITMFEDLAFNPSFNFAIPPGYALSLSVYSFVIALIIAMLVLTNVLKVSEMSKICTTRQKSFAIVALPALGVVGGATCCISLPFLISLLAPATAVVANSIGIYYVAYLAFPLATAVALKMNLDATSKIAVRLSGNGSQKIS
jgi:hypothetical protein